MQFDTTIKPKGIAQRIPINRGVLIGSGVTFIVISVVILGLSLWEGFGAGAGRFRMVEVPGFHELDLKTPGLYAGVYQHRGSGPLPVRDLSRLDVRVMSKTSYDEVPVLMNSTGQTFSQFGVTGMPVFSFVVQQPGVYTMSAVYPGDVKGPTVPIFIISQTVRNIKQTLIVGVSLFLFFLILGIVLLVKANHGTPNSPGGETKPPAKPKAPSGPTPV